MGAPGRKTVILRVLFGASGSKSPAPGSDTRGCSRITYWQKTAPFFFGGWIFLRVKIQKREPPGYLAAYNIIRQIPVPRLGDPAGRPLGGFYRGVGMSSVALAPFGRQRRPLEFISSVDQGTWHLGSGMLNRCTIPVGASRGKLNHMFSRCL